MPKTYRDLVGQGDDSHIVEQLAQHAARLSARLASVQHVIAVMSGKGGVGKSCLTANLAAALTMQGKRVGVVDADINGPTLATMLGARKQSLQMRDGAVMPAIGAAEIKVMSMDLMLPRDDAPVKWQTVGGLADERYVWLGMMELNVLREMIADTAWGELDYLLVDLPPGPERFPNVAKLIPRLETIVVTIPTEISHLVVSKSVTLAKETGARLIGLVENMTGYVCPHCGELGPLFGNESPMNAERVGIPFLGAVPFDHRIAESADRGIPFVLEHRDTVAGSAIMQIAAKIIHEERE
ncbi:MAG: P-loop NTPase [Chloroflexi bacterium]|nr:P-loop NTPase [Chloroflexota bacterium]